MSSILFVLPVGGGSGGAHSVMQEADAMRLLGIDAQVATNEDNVARLRRGYRDLQHIQNHVVAYRGAEGLSAVIAAIKADVVVATTNQSVHVIAAALRAGDHKSQRTAYYVQDYEPLFYPKGSADWLAAYQSYGLVPGMIHFAKTRWLQETVEANHRVQVLKVEASIDHKVYYPRLNERETASDRLRIVAMLRPQTPRRAPRRTVRIMNSIAHQMAGKVQCTTFGCTPDDLKSQSLRLSGVEHLGILPRDDVGDLFRNTDLFLDLSDFQAFGRTAIEGMSCGAIPVLPAHGGAYEYAVDGVNGFIVDVRSDDAILGAVSQFVSTSPEERREMMMAAIETGYRYTPERAALSEIKALL